MQTVINQTSAKYTSTAKFLHWLMAIAIICLFAFGFYMSNLPFSPQKLKLMSYHKWAGVTVFILALVRLSWRIMHRPPSLPAHMGRIEQLIAHAGHVMLYLLMLSIPVSGWLMSSAKGFQTVLFGVLPIPDLLSKDRELGHLLLTVHLGLNLVMAAVVIGHVLAALKHHFKDKDDVLIRMLPDSSNM
ncbi:cytochrome b [Solimicrobium silvestre]|uniref:Cytochrome B561 n=1 Tax=Solimicrobium silvestre TaxID=2099400 RepID=A0A2S9GSR9_9BURK|nr:cytochrome b [Solimicrobium silvestre]PRC90738.1 Cytochrome B561 [Solimicrobium silvestre]